MAQIAMYASVNHTCFGETYAAIQATSFHGVRSRWATPKLGLPTQWLPGPTLPSAPLPLRLTLLRLLPLVFIIILIGLCAQNEDGSWHFILSFFSVASLTWFTRTNHQIFESHKKKWKKNKKNKTKNIQLRVIGGVSHAAVYWQACCSDLGLPRGATFKQRD